jgi:hypothetical protein
VTILSTKLIMETDWSGLRLGVRLFTRLLTRLPTWFLTRLLGNSGKPVTLETLSLTKFLRHVFQEQETHDFQRPGTCEPRVRKCVKFGNLDSVNKWGREHAEARNLELAMARTSGDGRFGNLSRTQFRSHARRHARNFEEAKADSGICRGLGSGVTREDIYEPTEKQSQSCCPKKSGFGV